jgi:hypothetical protein
MLLRKQKRVSALSDDSGTPARDREHVAGQAVGRTREEPDDRIAPRPSPACRPAY